MHSCSSDITAVHIAMEIQNDFKIFLYLNYEKYLEVARAHYWFTGYNRLDPDRLYSPS